MTNTAAFRRDLAAAGLLTTAVLSLVSNLTSPEFPADGAARLAEIDAGGTSATLSAFAFALAQLPFLVAVLGLGHLLRQGAPVLSNLGTTLAAIGACGHLVFAGFALSQLSMAGDAANREVYGKLIEDVESSPLMVFAAMGLLGTVLGLVLLAVGLWRAQVGPRWVPPAIGAFIVVEFAGTSLSEWALPVSAAIYVLCFGALALTVRRTPAAAWQVTQPAPEPVRR